MKDNNKTLKVKCFITGEEFIFSGDYLNKLIQKYGSKENILKYYITFKAKNLLFKGYSIPEIRKILVLKKIKLPNITDEELQSFKAFWDEQKSKNIKYKINDDEKKIVFSKTDDDVKLFIDNWLNFKKNQ